MAERRQHKDKFQKLGFYTTRDDDGEKRLVYNGNLLRLSELDLDNPSGIKVVLPNGKKKIYRGIHRYTISANRIEIEGDLKL